MNIGKEKISFTWKDTFWSMLALFKWKWQKTIYSKRFKNYHVYQEGIKSFNSELDCVSIINSIRRFDAFIESTTNIKRKVSINQPITKPIKLEILESNKSKIHSKIKLNLKSFSYFSSASKLNKNCKQLGV